MTKIVDFSINLNEVYMPSVVKLSIDTDIFPRSSEEYSNNSYVTRGYLVRVLSDLMGGTLDIDKVIYNKPATIVIWKDGTKTVVKCREDDKFDKEKGLSMCITKKLLGNNGRYYEIFKKYCYNSEDITNDK